MSEATIEVVPAIPRVIEEHPISFNTAMVLAIRAGRKTQTRRIVRWPKAFGGAQPHGDRLDNVGDCVSVYATGPRGKNYVVTCPYGGEGDVLWVREAYRLPRSLDDQSPSFALSNGYDLVRHVTRYIADGAPDASAGRYRHARFMPRALARTTLDVTHHPDLQRLKDVTEEDAVAEGIEKLDKHGPLQWGLPEWPRTDRQPTAREAFLHLFEMINGPEIVAINPWVWVPHFRLRA